jgi:hypothetical protein
MMPFGRFDEDLAARLALSISSSILRWMSATRSAIGRVGRVGLHHDVDELAAVVAQAESGRALERVELAEVRRARERAHRLAVGDEALVGGVPHQRGEFVAVQETVPADGDVVGHRGRDRRNRRPNQHAVIAIVALEAVGDGGEIVRCP